MKLINLVLSPSRTKTLRAAVLKSDSIQKYKYPPTDNKTIILDDDLLFSKSINNSVEQKWTRKYEENLLLGMKRNIYESYLDQKLKENISKELVNFKREINSIVIKSNYIDLNNECINKPY